VGLSFDVPERWDNAQALLPDTGEISNTLWAKFQALNENISVTVTPSVPLDGTQGFPDFWVPRVNFAFQSSLPPTTWIPVFADVPGAKMDSIAYDPQANSWSYSGTIYAFHTNTVNLVRDLAAHANDPATPAPAPAAGDGT
jgi:hypothetical protein